MPLGAVVGACTGAYDASARRCSCPRRRCCGSSRASCRRSAGSRAPDVDRARDGEARLRVGAGRGGRRAAVPHGSRGRLRGVAGTGWVTGPRGVTMSVGGFEPPAGGGPVCSAEGDRTRSGGVASGCPGLQRQHAERRHRVIFSLLLSRRLSGRNIYLSTLIAFVTAVPSASSTPSSPCVSTLGRRLRLRLDDRPPGDRVHVHLLLLRVGDGPYRCLWSLPRRLRVASLLRVVGAFEGSTRIADAGIWLAARQASS